MLLSSRLMPVLLPALLSALLLLAGCEERVVDEPPSVTFDLLAPAANSNVTTVDGNKMKVKYSGSTSLTNLYLELNGADITAEFAMNNVSDLAVTDLANVRNAMIQGKNTLFVARKIMDANNQPVLDGNGRFTFDASRSFSFYFDDEAPRLTVDSVVPANTNVDGTPLASTTLIVKGKIVDASTVTAVTFTYPGGSVALASVNAAVLANNQFNPATKEYQVRLLNYPNVAAASSVPHFSYTATDNFKHRRTEQFLASGTALATSAALQINDSLTWNIAPLANSAINNGLILAQSQNIFGQGKPLKFATLNTSPVPGDLMRDPLVNCQPSLDLPGVKECRPYGTTRIFVYPANSTQCSGMLFNASAGVTDCVVFIKNVVLDQPNVDVDFSNPTNQLLATLEIWANWAYVDVEVAGIRVVGVPPFHDTYYLGGLQGRAEIGNFTVTTDVELSVNSNYLVEAKRVSPLKLNLTDILQVPKLTGTCNICSPLVSPLTMIILALGTDVNSNGQTDKKEILAKIDETLENKGGPMIDSALSNLLTAATKTKSNTANDKQVIENLSVVKTHAVYEDNAHFVLNSSSKVDPAFYTLDYQAVNGGLGSLFATQGSYYTNLFAKGWPITIAGQENLDITFAVSANAINQRLLADHQTGFLTDVKVPLTGADFTAAGVNVEPTDALELSFTTHEAPSVSFTSIDTTSSSLCLGKLCVINNGSAPGSVKVVANNLDVRLDNTTDAVTALEANINLEMEVELGAVDGLPSFVLKPNSAKVTVNSKVEPSSPLITNAAVGRVIAEGIEILMKSPSFAAMFGQQTKVISVATLPGSGGSGPGCAGASIDGEFCLSGTQVPYSALLVGTLPIDFDVAVRSLTIEKGGSYLSVGLDLRNRAGGNPPAADAFMTWQITN